MRARSDRRRALTLSFALILAVMMSAGCESAPATPRIHRSIYASAETVEENFRGKQFILGDNTSVALVRPLGSSKNAWLKLPFWLGVNVLVPGVTQPKEGDYYVISEAVLGKPLNTSEWMIEAGSTLVKQETVFEATRTHFLVDKGKLLPMIVQYMGMRQFIRGDGKKVEIPVVHEVSLPMKWNLGGGIPNSYARFRIE